MADTLSQLPDIVRSGKVRNHAAFTGARNPDFTSALRPFHWQADPGSSVNLRQTLNHQHPKRGINLQSLSAGLHFTQVANPRAGYAIGIKLAEHMQPKCVFQTKENTYEEDPRAAKIIRLAKNYLKDDTRENRQKLQELAARLEASSSNPPQAFNRYATACITELHHGILGYSLIHAVTSAQEAMDSAEETTALLRMLEHTLWHTLSKIQHPEGF